MTAVTSAASAAAARIGAALSDAQYFESSMIRIEDIRRQLDSRHTKDKLDAMKRVIALISLGKDASTFFPDVVKNVVATSLEVKKLVYLYLVHYAEQKQDLALLAINSFQKDLSDHNQHIRALSLRVLSSIRVKVILQVVILAVSKAAKDSSAYVRNAAAHAIGKVCALDDASREMLMQPLQDLIADRATQVMGSAIAAYEDVCPDSWELIHPHYRRICNSLVQVDPWGQVTILNMLLRYVRAHFAEPSPPRNPDIKLLLDSVSPLFMSLNNAVVVGALAIYFHVGTPDEFATLAIKPLMRLVSIRDEGGQAVALTIASAVATRFPNLLIPYLAEFHVSFVHSPLISKLRMQVLTRICAAAGQEGGMGSKPHARRMLLSELKDYLHRSDIELASATARAIGCLATAHPPSTTAIVKVLSSVVSSGNDASVVSESIGVLRRLLQRHPPAQARALPQLVAMLLSGSEKDAIREPAARASIIWLIGEFYEQVQMVATEALRLLARGFAEEAAEVKLQILNLAAKVVAWGESESDVTSAKVPPKVRHRLLEYVVSCARYDRDYDVRDKARILNYIFMTDCKPAIYKRACSAFLSRKPIPASAKGAGSELDDALESDVVIGSMAHVLRGRRLPGFQSLEPWAKVDSESSLRDEVLGKGEGAAANREYKGVSSADFRGSGYSSSVWDQSTSMSSTSVLSNGVTTSLKNNIGAMPQSGIPLAPQPLTFSLKTENVDPESFYAEESSEYDSESESDEDEATDNQEPPTASQKAPEAVNSENLLSELISVSDVPSQKASTKTQKPSSEYDLDALLGSMSVTGNVQGNKLPLPGSPVMLLSDTNSRTEWHRVVESWHAGGLEVDAAFVRSTSGSAADVSPVVIRVTNRGKTDASVSFVSQSGDSFEADESALQLPVSASGEKVVSARFRGKTGGVRFGIQVGESVVSSAELKPSTGFVMRPHPSITPNGFAAAEKSLTGMFGSEATMTIAPPEDSDWIHLSSDIRENVLQACFISHIRTSVGSASNVNERFSSVFAGYLPGKTADDKRTVLVRITVYSKDDDTGECLLWIGCEDVLFSANLMQVCRNAVSKDAKE